MPGEGNVLSLREQGSKQKQACPLSSHLLSESALLVNALKRWVGPGCTLETDTPGYFCQKKWNLSSTGCSGSCKVEGRFEGTTQIGAQLIPSPTWA